MNDRNHIYGVQYLRALAAISVVLFHISERAGYRLVGLAAFGVPLFFVISGFIMIVITNDETRPSTFLARRVMRVGPMYWLLTFAVVLLWPVNFHGYRDLAASLVFLPWHYTPEVRNFFPPLAVGWTLNLEMLFYLLFAVVLATTQARFRPLVLTIVLISLVAIGHSGLPIPARAAFFCQPLILLFAVGAWMGYSWRTGRVPLFIALPALAILIAWVLRLILAPGSLGPAGGVHMLVFGAMAAALVLERRGAFRKPFAPLHLLGDASYSIYLSHPLVLFAAVSLLRVDVLSVAASVVTFLVSIAVGIALYLVVERRLLRWGREMLSLRQPIAAEAW